uniref:hypothetical protein orf375 n=1 Tax=Tayloriella tenebrosa TaxID=1917049 RepID=UPI0022FD44C8|nr:hypothetical protein orf375 [Tayloriella tenebrosa]WAX03658.1 hypothetical protein orf375 [Tayloriella tenebrosa]
MNNVTFWEKLPWQRINIRILMITKQIYLAMKKYDLNYVYQLQKYIINCNETKVMLINKILCDLILYYSNCSNIKLLIRHINKLDILSSLIVKRLQSHQVNRVIIEYLKQDLIYTSIQPTLTAKISKKLTNFFNNTQLKNNISFYNKVSKKYFLTKIVIKKLGSYNYINKSIRIWLYKDICLNLSKIYNLKYKSCIIEKKIDVFKLITTTSKSLYFLINKILINDLYWYIFNYVRKKDSIWKVIDDVKVVIFTNDVMVNTLFKTFNTMFQQLLYRKTYKGFHRINVFNDNKNIVKKVKFLYKYYYSHIISFISLNLIENCNKLINCFTFTLIKKQNNQNLHKYEYIYKSLLINELLNKYIYFYNIEYFYQYTESAK